MAHCKWHCWVSLNSHRDKGDAVQTYQIKVYLPQITSTYPSSVLEECLFCKAPSRKAHLVKEVG